jgi:CBS domain-containing protein
MASLAVITSPSRVNRGRRQWVLAANPDVEETMNVNACMSTDVRICAPEDTIQEAARTMKDVDTGAIPVGENDRLVGMITDRDIAIRAVAAGRGPDTKVREAMSSDICYCFEDEDVTDVALQMADLQVRRLPVLNRDKRLVGIISLGDIAVTSDGDTSGAALSGVSQSGGQHNQASA